MIHKDMVFCMCVSFCLQIRTPIITFLEATEFYNTTGFGIVKAAVLSAEHPEELTADSQVWIKQSHPWPRLYQTRASIH